MLFRSNQSDAELTALLSRCTPTGGFPVVFMAGGAGDMSSQQIAAVNGQLEHLGTVNGYKARVLDGATVKHYNLKLDGADGALAAAQVGQEVRLEAATFAITSKLQPYRVTIRGAGTGSVVNGAVQAMGRNPDATPTIQTNMILGIAFAEAVANVRQHLDESGPAGCALLLSAVCGDTAHPLQLPLSHGRQFRQRLQRRRPGAERGGSLHHPASGRGGGAGGDRRHRPRDQIGRAHV